MGLLDSILGAVTGKTDGSGGAAQLIGVLGGLLAQSGGLQGLANKFAQSGQGNAFQSWVGMVKTSRSPTIKFKTCLVPSRSMRSRPEWEWIRLLCQRSWLSTCQRSSIS